MILSVSYKIKSKYFLISKLDLIQLTVLMSDFENLMKNSNLSLPSTSIYVNINFILLFLETFFCVFIKNILTENFLGVYQKLNDFKQTSQKVKFDLEPKTRTF